VTRDVLIDGRTLFVGTPERAGVAPGEDGGLYHRDTRHLSALTTTVAGTDLTAVGRDLPASNRRTVTAAALGSAVNRVDDSGQKRTDLVARQTQAVAEGSGLAGEVTLHNHTADQFSVTVDVSFAVDFADVFEVRGFATPGDRDLETTVTDRTVSYRYGYEHADGTPAVRTTTVAFDRPPASIDAGRATFDLDMDPQGQERLRYAVRPGVETGANRPAAGDGDDSGEIESVDRDPVDATATDPTDPATIDPTAPIRPPRIPTGRPDYDEVFERAGDDLVALTTDTEHGPVPLAGAPWFATVFGRDSLIAAYQALPVAPDLAAGTLRYLAAHQGTTTDDAREEQPGKVFHEMRHGELAHRNAVPHTPYYGTVDATPLWVVLLAEYHRWTGDEALVADLAGALDAALSWIESERAAGPEPFLAYDESPGVGLHHKAWRDTPGAVQHPDGTVADYPIASVEVQGYAYRALRDAATLYEDVLDDAERAARLSEAADDLAAAFESSFWVPDREFYAVARAGDGTVVPTATSNVGHCLWAGIVDEGRADTVADRLRSESLSTPWGLRTMSAAAAGYSPVSYHLGSVWPHDTSLTALGLADYGFEADAARLTRSVLSASTHFEEYRIPELFCGFAEGAPKPYPSSCVPQAWSAGAPFALLRADFGLDPAEDGLTVGSTPDVFEPEAVDPIRDCWTDRP
jgi:glycogen debranching enzyme